MSKFVGRNRLAVGAAAALTLSLVAGLAATAWQAQRARQQSHRAEKRFDEVRRLARSVVFELHDAIEELPGSNAARKILVEKALEYYNSLSAEMPDDPVLRQEMGRSYLRIGDVQGLPKFPNLGQSQEAMVSFRRSAELARLNVAACPESMAYRGDLLKAQHRIGFMFLGMGQTDSARFVAELNRREAEDLFTRYPDDPLPADLLSVTYSLLQEVLMEAGDTLAAEGLMGPRIEASRRALQLRPENEVFQESYFIDLYMAATLAEKQQEWSLASSLIRQCIQWGETQLITSPDNSTTRRELAIFYETLGKIFMHTARPDSAFIVLEKRQALVQGLAEADPTDHQIQADLADGEVLLAEAIQLAHGPAMAIAPLTLAVRRYQASAASDTADMTVLDGLVRTVLKLGDCQLALANSKGGGRRESCRDALESYEMARTILAGVAARGPLPASISAMAERVELKLAECRTQLRRS